MFISNYTESKIVEAILIKETYFSFNIFSINLNTFGLLKLWFCLLVQYLGQYFGPFMVNVWAFQSNLSALWAILCHLEYSLGSFRVTLDALSSNILECESFFYRHDLAHLWIRI